jgi:hypothetical protein
MTFNMKMALLIWVFTMCVVGNAHYGWFSNDTAPPGVHVYGPETTGSK